MKKHITIIALAMLSLATAFSGCNKSDDDKTESKKYNVRYELDNTAKSINPSTFEPVVYTLSPCFKANVTYTDADGKTVELKDITLPWQKEIIVEAPFDASVQAELTFNENELPESIVLVKSGRIEVKKDNEGEEFFVPFGFGDGASTMQKAKFLQNVQERPDYLKFGGQHSIK